MAMLFVWLCGLANQLREITLMPKHGRATYTKVISGFFSLFFYLSTNAFGMPPNAHQDLYRRGWSCDRGYYKSGQKCERVVVPENASIDVMGSGWACNRGYFRSGQKCEKVIVPENASVDVMGSGWACNRGYFRSGQKCEKVIVPENASVDVMGSGWACNRGYFRSGQKCEKVAVPENASVDVMGSGWACNRGYFRSGHKCEKVAVPENASIDFFGSGWVCNSGYKRKDNSCAQMTPQEVKKQRELEAAIAAEVKRRRGQGVNGDDCEVEYKTNAEVCVEIVDRGLDCNENYEGNYYRDCDATIRYEVNTSYSGGAYIDVDIECSVEIEYKGRNSYSMQSDYASDGESHSLYAHGSDDNSIILNFSFSSYREVTSVRISYAKCEVGDVNLY